jgi:hypothetical protein
MHHLVLQSITSDNSHSHSATTRTPKYKRKIAVTKKNKISLSCKHGISISNQQQPASNIEFSDPDRLID